jgi:SpoVK/Ycf46/Vps4 family AAA+-type ATPase
LYFLDEIDALMKNRNDPGNETASAIVSALLNEMQGRRNQVYVLGNTNVPSGLGEIIPLSMAIYYSTYYPRFPNE